LPIADVLPHMSITTVAIGVALSLVTASEPGPLASLDGIVGELYRVISGPAGHERDWDRFRDLFAPSATMGAVGRTPQGHVLRRMTPEEYIERSGPALKRQGFFETEVARRTERFGALAQVWSTYETRRSETDVKPDMRGINSIQMIHDGTRWRIVSLVWQGEDPETPLPSAYLPGR
jgi:hypothetical protein